MRNRSCQLNVAHSFTANGSLRDFDAAAIADNTLIADLLVLAAGALPVLCRTEDALAEQTVTLRLLRTIVNRLRLLYFAIGPFPDFFRGSEANPNRTEVIDIHSLSSLLDSSSPKPTTAASSGLSSIFF